VHIICKFIELSTTHWSLIGHIQINSLTKIGQTPLVSWSHVEFGLKMIYCLMTKSNLAVLSLILIWTPFVQDFKLKNCCLNFFMMRIWNCLEVCCRVPVISPIEVYETSHFSLRFCSPLLPVTNRAKMIGGRRPLVPEILSQSDRAGAKFEQAAITPKRYEIGCQLLLITNHSWPDSSNWWLWHIGLSIGTDLDDLEWPWTP